jgi:hypothetical protein
MDILKAVVKELLMVEWTVETMAAMLVDLWVVQMVDQSAVMKVVMKVDL